MPRKKGISNKGRKEGRTNKGSKKGRKEDKKEGTENPYTLNPNPSHTNHTTANNNQNRKTAIQQLCQER